MSFDYRYISGEELRFLVQYTKTLKLEFDTFMTALVLMQSSELSVNCPVRATELAKELQNMQAEFDGALAGLALKHDMRNKPDKVPHPPTEAVVKIIQSSFFKLVEQSPVKHDKGWFSGHPIDWEQQYKQHPLKEPPTNPFTAMFSAFFKLLNGPDNFFPTSIPDFPYKKLPSWPGDMHQPMDEFNEGDYYDDEEDDEDDDFQTPY